MAATPDPPAPDPPTPDSQAPDPAWQDAFFSGLTLDIWRAAVDEERLSAECDFIADALDLDPDDALLDVPCGEGRHAVELARRGYRPTGLDLSEPCLERARAAAAADPEIERPLAFLRRDMRDLQGLGPFRGAYCLGNAFGYFDGAGCRRFLAAVARTLEPGAGFLLHSGMIAESLLPNYEEEVSLEVGGFRMDCRNDYDVLAGRLDTRYRLERGGAVEERLGHHWIFTLRELAAMLAEAGFVDPQPCAEIDGRPFEIGDPQLYLLCRKA